MATTSDTPSASGGHSTMRNADLRGMSFNGADLAGADFTGARTGLRTGAKWIMVGSALAVSVALGVAAGAGGRLLRSLFESGEPRQVALALNAGAALVVLVVSAVWKGGEVATRVVLPVIAAMMVAAAAIAVLTGSGSGAGLLMVLGFLLLATAVIALGAFARTVAGEVAGAAFVLVALSGAITGGLLDGGVPAALVAFAALIIGKRTLRNQHAYPLLAKLALQGVCQRGTRFRNANLSGADFTDVQLTVCDFRGANLEGARVSEGTRIQMCLFDEGNELPPRSPLAPGEARGAERGTGAKTPSMAH